MNKEEYKEYYSSVYRHSLAHILAKAVMEIFGRENVQIAIGPQIADGMYYDFLLPRGISTEEFPAIEAKMKEIMTRREPWTRREVTKAEARRWGVWVTGTEIVGLTPMKALIDSAEYYLQLEGFDFDKQVIENYML